ncbi:PREDICTED: uncharacterized protein LOC108368789 [Rhagoletis zephyria]|uniref:uncharacterized protein LOC108368789 n=1 Tax=Rhagoletis zephyria TaxID=28612 RepID=UPI0008113A80|nr:PREDICTED: uncharacterized protein LOC108368789 [Rhagoletis zephyria]
MFGNVDFLSFDGEVTPPPTTSSGNIRTKVRQRELVLQRLESSRASLAELNTMTESMLKVKLEILQRYLDSFEAIQSQLEELDESELEGTHRAKFEAAYLVLKSAIMERLAHLRAIEPDTLSSTRIVSSSTHSRFHLPKLQLPKFSGHHADWLDFYDMFSVLVHTNNELSDIEKFQYLRSCLTDSAARLVQALEVTAVNYRKAVELLSARYDNKRLIFQSHLKRVFEIQRVMKPSATTLREFIDMVNGSLRAMESLTSKSQISDGIILHLLTSKLDESTRTKWEDEVATKWTNTSTSPLKLPSWDDLASFLERRCQSFNIMEASIASTKNIPSSPPRRHRTLKPQSSLLSTHADKCLLCDEQISHNAFNCSKFMALDPMDRFVLVKRKQLCLNCLGTKHSSSNCPSPRRCQHCRVSHHTLLHRHPPQAPQGREANKGTSSLPFALHVHDIRSEVILATALVHLDNRNDVTITARALLDSASQLNFITERIAQLLKVRRSKTNVEISGIGAVTTTSQQISLVGVSSLHSGFSSVLEAVILPSISSKQPQHRLNSTKWGIPTNINLADATFNQPGPIDILIRASLFFDILSVGQIKLSECLPTLQKTQLGWIVAGAITLSPPSSYPTSLLSLPALPCSTSLLVSSPSPELSNVTIQPQPALESLLEKFWKLEDDYHPETTRRKADERECENYFTQTTMRCPVTNKFIVRLPFSSNPSKLGHSFDIARRRFLAVEKRMLINDPVGAEYKKFIHEYIDLNHMIEITPTNSSASIGTYIPHHCVTKEDSSTTKLRVVFDASCRTSNGIALNQILRVGPTLQDTIFTVLLRFRTHSYVLMADITKMYRQILVDERDAKWQCILWRDSPSEPLKTYQLRTVTYGTSCAPFLAVRCLQQLAYDNMSNHPIGAAVTLRDFYVDNLMTGSNTIEDVIKIKRDVIDLLAKGGFPLRKFASNHNRIIDDISEPDKEAVIGGDVDYIKTLGLKWSPANDYFFFSYAPSQQRIPKANASMKAYGACVYAVSHTDGSAHTSLITAKSRVAPTKTVTLPRLELCAALLLAELLESVVSILAVNRRNVHCWSDSTIALSWIQGEPSRWTTFVGNRVAKIQQLTADYTWHHVSSSENPADLVSRGAKVRDLIGNNLWFHGPQVIHIQEYHWPSISNNIVVDVPEQRKQVHTLVVSPSEDIIEEHKFANNYLKLLRVFAYAKRFIDKLRNIPTECGTITAPELDDTLLLILRYIQQKSFTAEYKALQKGKHNSCWGQTLKCVTAIRHQASHFVTEVTPLRPHFD